MNIYSKRIYEIAENNNKYWVLILFDISGYHYVGLRVRPDATRTTLYVESIDKQIDLYGIREYSHSMIKRCIYEKNKPLEITDDELFLLLEKSKDSTLQYLKKNISPNVDGITYLKWCKDKFILNNKYKGSFFALKQGAIYWANMGYGVGSEMRKIRPVIVWRVSKDKSMCTIIPLTSKRYNDNYYFHYDLQSLPKATARIENMMNLSTKRLFEPYYLKGTLVFISNDDKDEIVKIIERYYLFK